MESCLKNNQSLLNFLDINKVSDFQLRRAKENANSVIFRTEEGLSDADNRQRLKDFFEESKGSYWLVENKKNGAVSIKVDNGEYSGAPAAQIGNVSIWDDDKVEKEVQRRLADYQKDMELKELKSEVQELRRLTEKESPAEKIFSRLEPFLPHVIQGAMKHFFPAQQISLAGVERINTAEDTEDTEDDNITDNTDNNSDTDMAEFTEKEAQRIEDACVKWGQADPRFYEVLEYIAGFAASGKTVKAGFLELDYRQFREMLFNFKY